MARYRGAASETLAELAVWPPGDPRGGLLELAADIEGADIEGARGGAAAACGAVLREAARRVARGSFGAKLCGGRGEADPVELVPGLPAPCAWRAGTRAARALRTAICRRS